MAQQPKIASHVFSILSLLALAVSLASGCDDEIASQGETDSGVPGAEASTSGSNSDVVLTTSAGSGGEGLETGGSQGITSSGGHGDGSGSGSGSGGDGGETPHGSYAVVTQLFTADETISYIIHTPSLSGGVQLGLEDAIEQPGRALGSGPGAQSLFVGTNDSARLDHFRLNASGSLERSASLSFINQGIRSIVEYQNQFLYVGEHRGHFFDGHTGQVVSFDTKANTVLASSQVTGTLYPREIATFAPEPIVADTTIYFPMGWRGDDNLSIPSRAGVLVYDTLTGQGSVVTDNRCGYVRDGVVGEDGLIYLVTEAYGSALYRVRPQAAPAPCMLRFDPRTQSFDPSFYIRLSDLSRDATAGSLVVSSEGQVFLRVLDEQLAQIAADTHPRVLASAHAWTWWKLNLGDHPHATHVEAIPPAGGSTIVLRAGGRSYYPRFAQDFGTTEFMSLSDADLGNVSATAPGLVFSVVDL